jgi:hypothetical protein
MACPIADVDKFSLTLDKKIFIKLFSKKIKMLAREKKVATSCKFYYVFGLPLG